MLRPRHYPIYSLLLFHTNLILQLNNLSALRVLTKHPVVIGISRISNVLLNCIASSKAEFLRPKEFINKMVNKVIRTESVLPRTANIYTFLVPPITST